MQPSKLEPRIQCDRYWLLTWTLYGNWLPDDTAVLAAIQYVVDQEFPLLIWTTEVPELNLKGGRIV